MFNDLLDIFERRKRHGDGRRRPGLLDRLLGRGHHDDDPRVTRGYDDHDDRRSFYRPDDDEDHGRYALSGSRRRRNDEDDDDDDDDQRRNDRALPDARSSLPLHTPPPSRKDAIAMASRSSPLPTTPRRRGGTFRAGRLLGFDIALHWSWPLAVLFIAWSLQGGYLPTVYPEWTDRQRWTVGFGAGLLMFGSVLAHELAHAVVARRRGYPAAGITLWLFGGASELEHEPRTARDEAWIALAGPLLTVVLAAAFAGLWAAGRALGLDALYPIASYLALSNALLAVFNLLPALPLDGGRVVRAVVWERSGSMLSGTRVAARAGRFLAGGLVAIGFLLLLRGYGFDGLWLAFMGWFLWGAASTSYQHQLLEISLSGVPVESLAEHDTPRVAPDLTLRELAREMQGAAGARAYFVSPVSEGDILGMVTVTDLGRVPEENWDTTSVYRAMTPRDQLVTVPTGTDAFAALRLMAVRNLTQLPVFQGREPRGLLTRAALQRAVQVRTAVGGER